MKVALDGDSYGQMTFRFLYRPPLGLGGADSGGSKGHLLPTQPRSRWTGHWSAPSSPATPSPSFTYRGCGGPWPGVLAAQQGRGALAGLRAQAAGKPRSHSRRAALCRGTAAWRRPLPRAQGLTAGGANARRAAGRGGARAAGGGRLGWERAPAGPPGYREQSTPPRASGPRSS